MKKKEREKGNSRRRCKFEQGDWRGPHKNGDNEKKILKKVRERETHTDFGGQSGPDKVKDKDESPKAGDVVRWKLDESGAYYIPYCISLPRTVRAYSGRDSLMIC